MDSRLVFLVVLLLQFGLGYSSSLYTPASVKKHSSYVDDDAPVRYVGGDISLLPDYEKAGAKYYDATGRPVDDVLAFCYDQGMNIMRVRLFVNPDDYSGVDKDANAKQDLDYIIPLCRRICEQGFALMLDFHYSDTWADPSKQWTPKAWEGLSDLELYQKIYDYTLQTLQTLKANGIVPDFIQPGNEISYGMLWGPYDGSSPKKIHVNSDTNWSRFATLLRKAVQACREVCPDAGIIIHTERVQQPWYLQAFYERLNDFGLDYDIIGLSYYPYFHGSLSVLDDALSSLESAFPDKQLMVVETGFPYKWEVPGTNQKVDYPYSEAGQNQFAHDLVDLLLQHPACNGLLWWWMEYNAKGTSLSGWYNAPLFNSETGRATPALTTLCSFGTGPLSDNGIYFVNLDDVSDQDSPWFDLFGRRVANPDAPGVYVCRGRKILVR